MKNKPKVTVVIPMFNSQDTICETLNSVVSQSIKEWEAICVDDGSTDRTIAVVEQYIVEHSNCDISVLRRDTVNKGGSVCRNIGGKAAKGEFLIFLDADDLLTDTCLEKRLESMKNKEIQFAVFPMAGFVNNDLKTAKTYSRLYVHDPLYFFVSGFGTWQVTSPIIRKSFFEQLGGFDESFLRFQDVEFHIRAIVNSKGKYLVMKDEDADCFYRQGGSSAIVVEKLKRTIEGCYKLITLVERYACQNVFQNRKKLSLSLLSLFCHLSIYQDRIIEIEPNFNRTNPVIESNLKEFLREPVITIIRIVDGISSVKLRLYVARVVDRFVRKKLAR